MTMYHPVVLAVNRELEVARDGRRSKDLLSKTSTSIRRKALKILKIINSLKVVQKVSGVGLALQVLGGLHRAQARHIQEIYKEKRIKLGKDLGLITIKGRIKGTRFVQATGELINLVA